MAQTAYVQAHGDINDGLPAVIRRSEAPLYTMVLAELARERLSPIGQDWMTPEDITLRLQKFSISVLSSQQHLLHPRGVEQRLTHLVSEGIVNALYAPDGTHYALSRQGVACLREWAPTVQSSQSPIVAYIRNTVPGLFR